VNPYKIDTYTTIDTGTGTGSIYTGDQWTSTDSTTTGTGVNYNAGVTIANYVVNGNNPTLYIRGSQGRKNGVIQISEGEEHTIELPDGSVLEIDKLGNFKVIDKDAKITYNASRNKAFNPFINASDLMGEFIDFLADRGIDPVSIMNCPVDLFVTWLIWKAAEADGDELAQQVRIEDHQMFKMLKSGQLNNILPQRPALPVPSRKWTERCRWCGKFISQKKCQCQIFFCEPMHMQRYAEKMAINF